MFYIFFLLGIVTHIIRSIYEYLKLKNKINTENKFIFIFMFFNMFVLWVSWFNMCEFDIYTINLGAFLKYLGLILFISGIIIFLIALLQIKTVENYKGDLITTGIYRYIRHPMYFAFILWIFGYSIFNEAFFSFIAGIIFSINIYYWKSVEEKLLIKSYREYETYMQKTLF